VSLNNKENEQRVDFDFSNFGFEIDKYMKEKMVYIRGGTFIMGAPKNEAPCVELDYKLAEKFKFKYNKKYDIKDETQHRVTLSPFWIGKYEISQMEYKKIMGANPSHFKKWFGRSNDFPVENVSWYDAIIYCNNLSARCGLKPYYTITTTNNGYAVNVLGGKGFRLPTEAEWEYACRAGSWRAYSTGDEISSRWKANYDGRYLYYDWFVTRLVIADDKQFRDKNGIYRGETVDVDSFDPNEFGLYNMHGNVGEWCWDYYGSYFGSVNPTGPKIGYSRIIRGGGYNLIRRDVRSASRRHAEGTQKYYNTGFRIVRSTD
jgi:formylglycine-generating enzyme required for sulfatase activity